MSIKKIIDQHFDCIEDYIIPKVLLTKKKFPGFFAHPVFYLSNQEGQIIGIIKDQNTMHPLHQICGILFFQRGHKQPFEEGGLLKRSLFYQKIAFELGFQQIVSAYLLKMDQVDYLMTPYLSHYQHYNFRSKYRYSIDQLQRLFILDVLLGNQDRTSSNWLHDRDQFMCIDNDRILLNAKRIYWIDKIPLSRHFNYAKGLILPQVKDSFLGLAIHFERLLKEQQFPKTVFEQGMKRFNIIKSMISKNKNIEEIYYHDVKNYLYLPAKNMDFYLAPIGGKQELYP
jgi:hypothetical protein